jgi:hypothetical protein
VFFPRYYKASLRERFAEATRLTFDVNSMTTTTPGKNAKTVENDTEGVLRNFFYELLLAVANPDDFHPRDVPAAGSHARTMSMRVPALCPKGVWLPQSLYIYTVMIQTTVPKD